MPLLGFISIPFQLLFGPVATYNLIMTLALGLVGLACMIMLRGILGGWLGPFIGGLFYGFSPVMLSHSAGHAQISFAPLIPLLLLLATNILIFQRHSPKAIGLLFGVLVAAQLLLGEEDLVLLLLTCVVLAAVLMVRFPSYIRLKNRYAATALGSAVCTFAVVAAWPVAEQFFGAMQIHGAIRDTSPYATNLASLVVPLPNSIELVPHWALGRDYTWYASIGFSQITAYLGVLLVAWLVIVVIVRRRSPLIQVVLACLVVLGILSLGASLHIGGHVVEIWLPWRVLKSSLLFQNVLPTSLSLFLDLGIAILLCASAMWVAEWSSLKRRGLGYVTLGAVLVPLLPTFHYPVYVPTTPSFFTTEAEGVVAGHTVLLSPFPRGTSSDNTAPEVWQAVARDRFNIVGGGIYVRQKSRNAEGIERPTTLNGTLDAIDEGRSYPRQTPAVITAEREDILGWRVRDVIVGPGRGEDIAESVVARVLGVKPRFVGGIYLWTNVQADLQSRLGNRD
jgi:hypothetical protein